MYRMIRIRIGVWPVRGDKNVSMSYFTVVILWALCFSYYRYTGGLWQYLNSQTLAYFNNKNEIVRSVNGHSLHVLGGSVTDPLTVFISSFRSTSNTINYISVRFTNHLHYINVFDSEPHLIHSTSLTWCFHSISSPRDLPDTHVMCIVIPFGQCCTYRRFNYVCLISFFHFLFCATTD
jgi:hypothetical protein